MPLDDHARPSSGLLSGVFDFVSRELESFVVNAGFVSTSQEDDNSHPVASSSRVKLPDKQSGKATKAVRREKDARTRQQHRQDSPRAGPSRQRLEVPQSSEARSFEPYPSKRSSMSRKNKPLRREAVPSGDEDELIGVDNGSSSSLAPPNAFRPPPTMPGSLYARSMSLEPTPEPDWERVRLVRFSAPDIPPSPSEGLRRKWGRGEETPSGNASGSDADNEVSSPAVTKNMSYRSKHNVKSRMDGIRDISRVENDGQHREGYDSDVSYRGSERRSPTIMKRRDTSTDSKKGRAHAVIPFPTEENDEENYPQINVINASPEPCANERNVETTLDVQPRTNCPVSPGARQHDKHRIELLEEEVRRLREELAKRTLPTCPPPPPPPPPPPNSSNQSVNVNTQIGRTLTDARSSLKRTAPPVELPINPAMYGAAPRTQRKGLPTLKVDNDKMAEFLKEMKNHRLRKISNSADGSFTANTTTTSHRSNASVDLDSSRDHSTQRSFVSLRQRSIPQADGEQGLLALKRKRTVEEVGIDSASFADQRLSKRRDIGDVERSTLSRSLPLRQPTERDLTRSTLPSLPPPVSSSSHARSSIDGSRHDPYLPTPSLCSDNDAEGSYEDRPPATPPPATQLPTKDKRPEICETLASPASNSPVCTNLQARQSQRGDTSARASGRQTPEGRKAKPSSAVDNAFAKRPPKSPMPLDTPRRPRPPGKAKARETQVVTNDTVASVDAALSSLAPQPVPLHNDIFAELPSSPTTSRHRSRSLSKASHTSSSANVSRRRDTLHDELLRANPLIMDSHTDEEEDLESGILSGFGVRNSGERFLAHGGGGGVPAYVDTGISAGAGVPKVAGSRNVVRERTQSQSQSRIPTAKSKRTNKRN